MQVLIVDALPPEARAGLEALGLTVSYQPDLTVDTLPAAIGDCEVLVVDQTAVTRRALEKAGTLALIVRAGSGVDGIALEAASARAIFVSHCPGFDAAARAEHALGQLVAIDRARVDGAIGLSGRSLGLHGYTETARLLARAASGLGMAVRVHAPSMTRSLASEAGLSLSQDADELFRRCDFVSVHGDAGSVGPEQLGRMRDGGIVIAVDGLGAIDLAVLKDEVAAGRLLASVDAPVVGGDSDALDALGALPGATVTRGQAGGTSEASRTAAAEVVRTVHDYLHDGTVRHALNLSAPGEAGVASLVIRHTQDMTGLVAIFDVLRDEGIRALDIGNALFEGGGAGSLHMRVDAVPSPAALDKIRRHQCVLQVHQT